MKLIVEDEILKDYENSENQQYKNYEKPEYLEDIFIPEKVKIISECALAECCTLRSVTLNKDVEEIQEYAFSKCHNLEKVYISESVKKIDIIAFYDCSSLQQIIVSEKNPYFSDMDGVLFNKDKTELIYYPIAREGSYKVPEGVERIGEEAFYNAYALTDISFPEDLKFIGADAFICCYRLSEIRLPEKLISLEYSIFEECENLSSVTIGSCVEKIHNNAFLGCYNLENIIVSEKNSYYSDIDGVLFSKDKKTLIYYPSTYEKNYTIPDGVEVIASGAFPNNNLNKVSIPDSITSIAYDAFNKYTKSINIEIRKKNKRGNIHYDLESGFNNNNIDFIIELCKDEEFCDENLKKIIYESGNNIKCDF